VNPPAIQFEGFSFRYKSQQRPTLTGINLSIREGEKVLILGASGSGKSTLANCVNGLIPFSYEGTIGGVCRVNGRNTAELSIFRLSREVGTVLQDSDAQFVGLSVGEDIAFSLENDGMPWGAMREAVRQSARVVGMGAFLSALPFHLSGGQKQKTALAGALGQDTRILIFDEPLASLDPRTGTAAMELIDQVVRERRCTALIIEHRLEDALFRPVDRIILMDKGQVAADMSPEELLRGDLLERCGIREPLYLRALRHAGCDLRKQERPASAEGIVLDQEDREKLRAFCGGPLGEERRQSGEELLRLEEVSFSYKEGGLGPAVKNLSFTLRRGERAAFIGKNGAGKSTAAKLITGLCRPDQGAVYIKGQDARGMTVKEIGGQVGYVMQDPNQMLVKDTIKDEVELALRLRGLPEATVLERTRAALEICELYRMRNWPAGAVSYGQKKRITIAAVLALEPEALILDEPTAGQDYRHYREFIDFINRLNREYGKTIILITHDMYLAVENTDRALVFTDDNAGGSLLADGDIFSILTDQGLREAANLKRTSLQRLALAAGLPEEAFVRNEIMQGRKEAPIKPGGADS
jgi:energy-coupling factor transport system ATP-binding protein